MDYDEMYVTPEEFEAAEALGISRRQVQTRLYNYGWRKADALTRPLRKQVDRTYWRTIAEANGINRQIFYKRVKALGWSEERAATEPVMDPREVILECNQRKRTISDEELAQAAANGIPIATVHTRLRNGWTKEEAISRPPLTGPERGRASRDKHDPTLDVWGSSVFYSPLFKQRKKG